MTKSELIDALALRRTDLTKARAELVVNCVFDAMIEALQRGEGIEIRGFGSFTVRPYKPYSGRNPRTGQPVDVPAKRLPFFKVGKELKEIVNGSRHLPITGGKDDDKEAEPIPVSLFLPVAQQLAVLQNGIVELHVRAELAQRLQQSRQAARPLHVKAGFGP